LGGITTGVQQRPIEGVKIDRLKKGAIKKEARKKLTMIKDFE